MLHVACRTPALGLLQVAPRTFHVGIGVYGVPTFDVQTCDALTFDVLTFDLP